MFHVILERYYLGAIALVLLIFAINFISAINTYLDLKERNEDKKDSFKIDFFFVILIVLMANIWYQSSKHELKEKFKNSAQIICMQNDNFIIISKDKNYTLKDNFFIKGDRAIDINKCKTLEDTYEKLN